MIGRQELGHRWVLRQMAVMVAADRKEHDGTLGIPGRAADHCDER
jgi:hypothetical protein